MTPLRWIQYSGATIAVTVLVLAVAGLLPPWWVAAPLPIMIVVAAATLRLDPHLWRYVKLGLDPTDGRPSR